MSIVQTKSVGILAAVGPLHLIPHSTPSECHTWPSRNVAVQCRAIHRINGAGANIDCAIQIFAYVHLTTYVSLVTLVLID